MGQSAPAGCSAVAQRNGPESGFAHRGADSIGADENVVSGCGVAAVALVELNGDRGGKSSEERGVKLVAIEGERRRHAREYAGGVNRLKLCALSGSNGHTFD